ncbi:hypothetical protein Tco_0104847 [Tanacetum coccineum]
MNFEESVQDAAMDAKELIKDDVVDAQEPKQDDDVTKFNEMVNVEKDPKEFDDLLGSTIDFIKFANKCLKKDKLAKEDLEGPVFALLKGNFKNNIELEYNLEQCYLALTDRIDWANPKGGKCPYDLSKPLPLQGPPGHKTIHVDFFFNKDLEYLKTGNKENKYDVSLTKRKAARTIIKKRVEDVQLEVESYQTKLNITFPQTKCDGLDFKEPYTIVYDPIGVVYQNKSNRKIIMRAEELYKFSDGTLKLVYDNMDSMLHNFELGFNNQGMPSRAWSVKDHKRTASMLKKN